jgi:hypothetical protein
MRCSWTANAKAETMISRTCFIPIRLSFRNQRLRDEECCWRVGESMQAKVPGMRISFHEVGALRPLPHSQMPSLHIGRKRPDNFLQSAGDLA